MSDVAASGGYYISAGANKIIAEPSTITGSIGVLAGKPVMKGLYDWLGVTNEYVLRGKNAGMFRETEKFSDDERAKFEFWIRTTYTDFISKVAQGRKMQVDDVDKKGQGRVWTGWQGKDGEGKGLVDEYGGLDRAVEVARDLAGLPKDKSVRRVVLPQPRTLLQEWLSLGSDSETSETPEMKQQRAVLAVLPEDARRAFRYAAMLDRMKQGDAALVMPFDLRVK
jgi:protease-4